MEDTIDTGEQLENSKVPKQLQPYMYKKGQSGNLSGRPLGISLKEYVKRKFNTMTDEEREEFLEGIDKKSIWEMGESKPSQGIGQADDLEKLQGVVYLPMKDATNTLETTTKTDSSTN